MLQRRKIIHTSERGTGPEIIISTSHPNLSNVSALINQFTVSQTPSKQILQTRIWKIKWYHDKNNVVLPTTSLSNIFKLKDSNQTLHMCGFGLLSLLKAIMGHLYKPSTNGFMLYVWRLLLSASCSKWQPGKKNKLGKKILLWVRVWLSCNKDSCRTYPDLLSTLSNSTEQSATGDKQNLLSHFWTELLQLSGQRKCWFWLSVPDSWASPQVTFAVTLLSMAAFVFDHFCLSLLCWGPKAVFGFAAAASKRCSGPEVIMWAAYQRRLQDTLDVNRQRDESPATVTRSFGASLEVWLVCGRFPTRQQSSLDSPDAEGRLSSHAVTNCRSDSRAAIELRGRMQRSPEKLLRSKAWKRW